MLQYVVKLFVLGMIAGAIGDYCHAYTKVLGYPHPEILNYLAWWVPPEFGTGGVLLGLLYGPLSRLLSPKSDSEIITHAIEISNLQTVLGPSLFLSSYLLSSLLNHLQIPDVQISLILGLLALMTWQYAANGEWSALVLGIVIGAGGVFWENSLCAFGVFWYIQPDFFLVRHWICWLWFSACVGTAPLFLKMELNHNSKSKTN